MSQRSAGSYPPLVQEQRLHPIAVATRGFALVNQLSNGTDTSGNYCTNHRANAATSDPQLVYGNLLQSGTQPDTITVRASIEYPNGTFYPVFFRGRRDVVIEAGSSLVFSDPVGIDIPAGADFYVWTYVSVASAGQKWPLSQLITSTGRGTVHSDGRREGITTGAPASDLTLGGGSIGNVNGYAYSPIAIVGRTETPAKAVAIFGDSISTGQNDGGTQAVSTAGYGSGFAARALSGSFAWISAATPGDVTVSNVGNGLPSRARLPLLALCTHALCGYGNNDIWGGGKTFALASADLVTFWDRLARRGVKVHQITLPPRTVSGTDMTVYNATASGHRITLNDWLRDGAPIDASTLAVQAAGTPGSNSIVRVGSTDHPLQAVHETADATETARNSGAWKTGFVSGGDGTHPTQAGYDAMRDAIDLTKFAL